MAKKRVFKCVWKESWKKYGNLEAPAKLILYVLLDYMDKDGKNCLISQETISRATSLSVPTVQRHLAKIVKSGWLKRLKRGKGGGKGLQRHKHEARIPQKLREYKDADPDQKVY